MRLSRRTVLKGGVVAGSAIVTPARSATSGRALVVFDSRIPESLAFIATHVGARKFDVAPGIAVARQRLAGLRHVTGLTRWSDLTVLRGLFEAQGLRLADETPVAAPLSGRTHLFRWTMVAR